MALLDLDSARILEMVVANGADEENFTVHIKKSTTRLFEDQDRQHPMLNTPFYD